MKLAAILFQIPICVVTVSAQSSQQSQNPLSRRYHEGEKLTYRMKGINENWRYEIQADGIVKKDSQGFFEEYAWSKLISDHKEAALPPAAVSFREQVTLDPNHINGFPNLAGMGGLAGPVTDLLTFYVDLWMANNLGRLKHPGDHFYFKRSTPNSWADGNYVLLGQDSIDFDFTLKEVNTSDRTVTLLVRHVPPANPDIKIPAEWMRKPVADTPNNWIEIQKQSSGKYLAAVGKESFDVEIKLSMDDGVIISAKMDNPAVTTEWECEDAALTKCGDPKPHQIRRQIEMYLQR